MKVALMSYHANVYELYPEDWLKDYSNSIKNQTFKDFDIFEVNYGQGFGMIFFKSIFQSKKFPTFVHCMNWMLDVLFKEKGYDYVFNSNVDDAYDPTWIDRTLTQIQKGYDIVSCNFKLFDERGIFHTHNFQLLNIRNELRKNHNIICHPGVCYSKNFWLNNNRYDPQEIPYEDMKLWQRAINNNQRFYILPQHLVLHRVHNNSVCKSNNR